MKLKALLWAIKSNKHILYHCTTQKRLWLCLQDCRYVECLGSVIKVLNCHLDDLTEFGSCWDLYETSVAKELDLARIALCSSKFPPYMWRLWTHLRLDFGKAACLTLSSPDPLGQRLLNLCATCDTLGWWIASLPKLTGAAICVSSMKDILLAWCYIIWKYNEWEWKG